MLKQNQEKIEKVVFDIDTFKLVLEMTQEELKDALANTLLPSFYDRNKIISKDGYIKVIGSEDLMILAHMDTVFKSPPETFIYDKHQGLLTSPDGIGGDDRCGVYGILALLIAGYRPHILFTEDEEIGGIGATKASKTQVIPKSIKYLIQLDRRGKDDAVFYCCDNPKFHKFVESYGFKKQRGSFTDIDTLMPVWDICGVNLSIGYHNEHNKNEFINLNYMSETLKKVAKMLETLPKEKHEFIEEEKISLTSIYGRGRNPYQRRSLKDFYDSFDCQCEACGKYKDAKQVNTYYNIDICDDCYALVGKLV